MSLEAEKQSLCIIAEGWIKVNPFTKRLLGRGVDDWPDAMLFNRCVITSYSIHYTKLYESEGLGIALVNSHRRLRLVYGAPYGLALESKVGEGTAVTVSIPLGNGGGIEC